MIKLANFIVCKKTDKDPKSKLLNIYEYFDHIYLNFAKTVKMGNKKTVINWKGSNFLDVFHLYTPLELLTFWYHKDPPKKSITEDRQVTYYFGIYDPKNKPVVKTKKINIKFPKGIKRINGTLKLDKLVIKPIEGRYFIRLFANNNSNKVFRKIAESPIDISHRYVEPKREGEFFSANY